jgi:uncharacterized membrane protein YidH (DUF202 family)
MRGRATAVALPAVVVLALVAVVAIAATGSTSSGTGTTRPPAEALLDMLFTLGLIAVLAGGVLLVYGLTQRKAVARQMATGRYRSSLVGWVVLAGVYAALWYFRPNNLGFTQSDSGIEDPLFPDREPGSTEAQRGTDYEPRISWLAIALVVGLAVAGIAAYAASKRRARERGPGDEELAADLAHALDDSLDDLRAEADPRRAIIATYARLERVLAANGIPCRPAETAQEYVPRVLRGLALDPRAVERLADLFARAKFSHHDVDATMKEEAIHALEDVREELRLAAEESAREQLDDSVPAAGAAS